MRNGTQEELDAAWEDAECIPFNVMFKVIDNDNRSNFDIGFIVYRKKHDDDDANSVMFAAEGRKDSWFFSPSRLGVINA